ncbi:MAG: hypothetical protein K1X91_12535 [Bacteriodetes bacterium]|nr:hypothetical protein [Bacteroidota bacterium]
MKLLRSANAAKVLLLFTSVLLISNTNATGSTNRTNQKILSGYSNDDDPKKKGFRLFTTGAEMFSSYKIPDTSSISLYAQVEYKEMGKILLVHQKDIYHSVVIGSSDLKLVFGELDLSSNQHSVKSEFTLNSGEKIYTMYCVKNNLYLYTYYWDIDPTTWLYKDKQPKQLTQLRRVFDITTYKHVSTEVLFTTLPKKEFFVDKELPTERDKLLPLNDKIFMDPKIDLNYMRGDVFFSTDSTHFFIYSWITDDDYVGHYFIREYIINSEETFDYRATFAYSKNICNFPTLLGIKGGVALERQWLKNNEYMSTALYISNQGKFDSITFSFDPLIKDYPDRDEIHIVPPSRTYVTKSGNVELLYKIANKEYEFVALGKVEINVQEKKVVNISMLKLDKEFRKQYNINDELTGAILNSSSYRENGDFVVCIENLQCYSQTGAKYKGYTLICLKPNFTCKWTYSNQERSTSGTCNCRNYYDAQMFTNNDSNTVKLSVFDDEPEKGLWQITLDAETGKVLKKEMPIDFSGVVILPTNVLNNYNGKFYITTSLRDENQIHIFTKK